MNLIKNFFPQRIILIVLVIVSINSCRKDDDNENSQLESNAPTPASIDYIKSYPIESVYPTIYDATETTSGGHAICGQFYGFPRKGIVVLTNNSSDSIWIRTIRDSIDIAAISVIETDDKGLLLLCSHNLQTNRNIILLKLDKDGNELWRKDYFGSVGFNGNNKLLKTENNTYTICGITRSTISDSKMYMLTVDENGDSLSSKLFSNSNNEICNSAVISNYGGFIMAGSGASFNNQMTVRKVSNSKTELFSKLFNEGNSAIAFSVTEDISDNIYVLTKLQEGASNSLAIFKLDKQGDLLFFKKYLTSERSVLPTHIFLSKNNELVITTEEQQSPLITSIIKMDLSGTIISRDVLEYFKAYKTFEDSNGDLFVTGTEGGNLAILKLKFS